MKTKTSKKFKKIQTLAIIFTLSFTGIPVNPVWAGSTTKIEKIAGPTLAEKPVTSTDKTTTLRAPAFVGRTDLGDSTASPGPLSIVTKATANLKAPVTTKGPKPARLPDHYYDKNGVDRGPMLKKQGLAPSNNTNFRGVVPASAPQTNVFTVNWQSDYDHATSTKHLELLKLAFTMGALSSDKKSRPFYDGTGALAATVYYKNGKLAKITYAADPVNLTYSYGTSGYLTECRGITGYIDRCQGPPLDPKIISQDGVSPLIMDIAFYNSYASITTFLDTFYTRADNVIHVPRGRQVRRYCDLAAGCYFDDGRVALVDMAVDEYGEASSATITFPKTHQVFTYLKTGNTFALTSSMINPNASARTSFVTVPEKPAVFSVPDVIWKEAANHIAYLKLAYTQSPRSTNSKKFFLDAAGHVAATVYYNTSGKIKAIRYADPYYHYDYLTKDYGEGDEGQFDSCQDHDEDVVDCSAPPMDPTVISQAGSPLKMDLVFLNTQSAHTKLLDKFYNKFTLLRTQKNHQVTVYRVRSDDTQAAVVDVELDDRGKQVKATITYDATHQVVTYGSSTAFHKFLTRFPTARGLPV